MFRNRWAKLREGIHNFWLNQPWIFFQFLRVNNIITDARVDSLPYLQEEDFPGVRVRTLDITREEYELFLNQNILKKYRKHKFTHVKVLEYITTYKLLDIGPESEVLDAAGGWGEYSIAMREIAKPSKLLCNDAYYMGTKENKKYGIRFIGGCASSLDLPSSSLTAISCHHSYEHFEADADKGFLHEALRLLRPMGRLCIVPLFLGTTYCEIWNKRPKTKYDSAATTIFDPLGTFPGWGGPTQGFARVYDENAFRSRILSNIPETAVVELVNVLYDGRACPDIKKDPRHPRVNTRMKALLVTKTG